MDDEHLLTFVDALFYSFSCVTQAGLSVTDWPRANRVTHVLSVILMFLGSMPLLALVPPLLRRYNFRKQHRTWRKAQRVRKEEARRSIAQGVDGAMAAPLTSPALAARKGPRELLPDNRSAASDPAHVTENALFDEEASLEYRALGVVINVTVLYSFVWLLDGFVLLWLLAKQSAELPDDESSASVVWYATASAFNNNGLTLSENSFVDYPRPFLICAGLLVLAGNTMFPVLLRWILLLTPASPEPKRPILAHRKNFMSVDLQPGFTCLQLGDLSMATNFLLLVCMYVAASPTVVVMRGTRIGRRTKGSGRKNARSRNRTMGIASAFSQDQVVQERAASGTLHLPRAGGSAISKRQFDPEDDEPASLPDSTAAPTSTTTASEAAAIGDPTTTAEERQNASGSSSSSSSEERSACSSDDGPASPVQLDITGRPEGVEDEDEERNSISAQARHYLGKDIFALTVLTFAILAAERGRFRNVTETLVGVSLSVSGIGAELPSTAPPERSLLLLGGRGRRRDPSEILPIMDVTTAGGGDVGSVINAPKSGADAEFRDGDPRGGKISSRRRFERWLRHDRPSRSDLFARGFLKSNADAPRPPEAATESPVMGMEVEDDEPTERKIAFARKRELLDGFFRERQIRRAHKLPRMIGSSAFADEEADEEDDVLAHADDETRARFVHDALVASTSSGSGAFAANEDVEATTRALLASAEEDAASAAADLAKAIRADLLAENRQTNGVPEYRHALHGLLQARAEIEAGYPGVEIVKYQQERKRKAYLEQVQKMLRTTELLKEMIFEEQKGSRELLKLVDTLPELMAGDNGGGEVHAGSAADAAEPTPSASSTPASHARRCCAERVRFLFVPLKETLIAEVTSTVKGSHKIWPVSLAGAADADDSAAFNHETSTTSASSKKNGRVTVDENLRQGAAMWDALWTSFTVQQRFLTVLTSMSGSTLNTSPTSKNLEQDNYLCRLLAEPVIRAFHYHFLRPASELARLDHPEWAFRYFLEQLTANVAALRVWAKEAEMTTATTGAPSTATTGGASSSTARMSASTAPVLADVVRGLTVEVTRGTLVAFLRAHYAQFLEDDALFANLIKELSAFVPKLQRRLLEGKEFRFDDNGGERNRTSAFSSTSPLDHLSSDERHQQFVKRLTQETALRDFVDDLSVVLPSGVESRRMLSHWIALDRAFLAEKLSKVATESLALLSSLHGAACGGGDKKNPGSNDRDSIRSSTTEAAPTAANKSSASGLDADEIASELDAQREFLDHLCRVALDRFVPILGVSGGHKRARARYLEEAVNAAAEDSVLVFLKQSWNATVVSEDGEKFDYAAGAAMMRLAFLFLHAFRKHWVSMRAAAGGPSTGIIGGAETGAGTTPGSSSSVAIDIDCVRALDELKNLMFDHVTDFFFRVELPRRITDHERLFAEVNQGPLNAATGTFATSPSKSSASSAYFLEDGRFAEARVVARTVDRTAESAKKTDAAVLEKKQILLLPKKMRKRVGATLKK
eukprot:g1398.t1